MKRRKCSVNHVYFLQVFENVISSKPKVKFIPEEFAAHGADVKCLGLGHKSGRVMVTGGDDRKVNLWSVGKPHCIMVCYAAVILIYCINQMWQLCFTYKHVFIHFNQMHYVSLLIQHFVCFSQVSYS